MLSLIHVSNTTRAKTTANAVPNGGKEEATHRTQRHPHRRAQAARDSIRRTFGGIDASQRSHQDNDKDHEHHHKGNKTGQRRKHIAASTEMGQQGNDQGKQGQSNSNPVQNKVGQKHFVLSIKAMDQLAELRDIRPYKRCLGRCTHIHHTIAPCAIVPQPKIDKGPALCCQSGKVKILEERFVVSVPYHGEDFENQRCKRRKGRNKRKKGHFKKSEEREKQKEKEGNRRVDLYAISRSWNSAKPKRVDWSQETDMVHMYL